MRVRFPSPAPLKGTHARVVVVEESSRMLVCSLPSWRTAKNIFAHVAQSVEHLLGKEEVVGSIPIVSTMAIEYLISYFI